MARTVPLKLNGHEWHMPANYAASKEFAELVGDPLVLALSMEKDEMRVSLDMIVTGLHIGVKHAGSNLSKEKVGEHVVDDGIANFIEPFGKYIAAMVMGGPEKPVKGSGKKKQETDPG